MTQRRIYADHAATTPMRREAIDAMLPLLDAGGFNASSAYAEGRAARLALDRARARVAALLGGAPSEIVFTGGGSEADALALVGVARARRSAGRHIVSAATEHAAVLRTLEALADDGFEVTILPVDADGRVDVDAFERNLRPDTILATVMLANNEVGTVQPVAALAAAARSRGVVFHTDAVQAAGRLPIDVEALGVDVLTLTGHKFYGPKGVGALYVRRGTPLVPLVLGGSQEGGRRAGTENVAGAVGFARALELADTERPLEAERLRLLRDRFEAAVLATVPRARVHAAGAARLPNLSSVAFAGADALALQVLLDLEGVAVSTGSACASGATLPSHVLAALGAPAEAALGTVRFSFGKLTAEQDVAALVGMLPRVVAATAAAPREELAGLGTSHHGPATGASEVRT